MKKIFFIDFNYHKLLPFTYTRSALDIRVGIFTIRKKWEFFGINNYLVFSLDDFKSAKNSLSNDDELIINSAIIPDKDLYNEILSLKNTKLIKDNNIIACHKSANTNFDEVPSVEYKKELLFLNNICNIFLLNPICIDSDFQLITEGRKSQNISSTNLCFGKHQIFIEEGATVECSTLNSSEGIIYVGKDAKIMEGSHIRGPFALCEHAEVKMGSKIYSGTTIGPYCKVAGEISNSVIFAYSNKAHDGFLGNSVIGEWCNLGAGTNNSNLKNNYSDVKIWNFETNSYMSTNLLFCGLFMGDHSKAAIATKFNTGTTVGVAVNVAATGFPPKFIPSFSWLIDDKIEDYSFEKAIDTMKKVMLRRNITITDEQIQNYKKLFLKNKGNKTI